MGFTTLAYVWNTVESRFSEPLREMKISFKKKVVQGIGDKIQERDTTFGSSYREAWKNEGSRNWDSL